MLKIVKKLAVLKNLFYICIIQKTINMTTETFFITISGNKIELELRADAFGWNVYCNSDLLDFHGSVFQGHYNYNNKCIIMYIDHQAWTFFQDEIRVKVEKILRKIKILRK